MLIKRQHVSKHVLEDGRFIDIWSLITTLNAVRILKYDKEYNISNTTYKLSTPLKPSILSHYSNNGVCKYPIVVTDKDFCLDGRHRVVYRKQTNDLICPAYIVPDEYVDKFIKSF